MPDCLLVVAEILRGASAEMAEAAAWYDERVAGLGERFLSEAEAAFARIEETPLTGVPWTHRRLPAGVRRMFLRSFPYSAVSVKLGGSTKHDTDMDLNNNPSGRHIGASVDSSQCYDRCLDTFRNGELDMMSEEEINAAKAAYGAH